MNNLHNKNRTDSDLGGKSEEADDFYIPIGAILVELDCPNNLAGIELLMIAVLFDPIPTTESVHAIEVITRRYLYSRRRRRIYSGIRNLTTEDYVKKIDAGFYDDGYGIILGTIRLGKYKGFKSCLVDIDRREGVEAFCDLGTKRRQSEK